MNSTVSGMHFLCFLNHLKMHDEICHKLPRERIKGCINSSIAHLPNLENVVINSSAKSLVYT